MTAGRDRRPLAGFLGAAGISTLGTRMSMLALPWLVLTTTGSPTLTGVVAFAEMAPYVSVQAIGGPMVDRLGARRASVGTDLLAAAFLGLVPVLFTARLLPLPALAGLVAATGGVRGAGDCARQVMLPGVGTIARQPLERSTGLFDGVSRTAALAGLPLAGTLVAVSSPLSVLAIDAGTFAASAALVAALVPRAAQPPRRGRADAGSSYRSSLTEGFRFLRGDRLLLAIAAMIMVTNFIDQAGGAVLWPVWAHDVARSPVALGLLGGALGLGAVAGNGLVTWAGPRLPRRMTYAVGFLVGGAPRFLVLAAVGSVAVVLAVVGVSGFGLGGINPVVGAAEYERVPRHLQARVLGAVGASAWAGIPLGGLAGGLAVSAFGLRPALLAAGVLYGVVTLAPFTFPVWRQLDRRPAPPPGVGATAPGSPAGKAAAGPA